MTLIQRIAEKVTKYKENKLQKNQKKIQTNAPKKSSIVSVVKCKNYDRSLVEKAIKNSLKNIGGLQQFIKPGNKVHIKPNLLTAKSPEKAATTHPEIVRAVVQSVQKLGGIVTIGDSPAGISRPIEQYWKNTGMEQVAKETGAKLVRFEKNEVTKCVVNGTSYYITKAITEADVVINVCKLKTHNLTLYTGALKNMFGTIPGFRKSEYHKQAPKVQEFSKIIVDVFSATKPQLTIMDGVTIMEGNGPSAGSPKDLGLILAGIDAVALDSVAAGILGFNDGEILSTEIAFQRGLGEKRKDKIIIKGDGLKEIDELTFSLPTNHLLNFIPTSLIKTLGKLLWVRPKPDVETCKRCGDCIKKCPTQAMTPEDGFPIINYDKCISCFCCDEVCPHDAIDQKMSWLAKKFS